MSVTQITDDNIDTGIDTSKCIGAIGAMDGSALTGINAGTSLLKNATNPAVDTNPADGVGAIWINTATGQMFSCTDATTDQNTWTNMGSGTGHVTYTPPAWQFQGRTTGYVISGVRDNIESHSYISDTGGTLTGQLVDRTYQGGYGSASMTHGYHACGYGDGAVRTTVQKFAFSSSVSAANISNTTVAKYVGASCSSEYYGYYIGGAPHTGDIQKQSHTNDSSCVKIGDMSGNIYMSYAGGWSAPNDLFVSRPYDSNIHKISLASDTSSTHHANLYSTTYTSGSAHTSSQTHGYRHGGAPGTGTNPTTVSKFAFNSGSTEVNIGNISGGWYGGRNAAAGSAGETAGYVVGGYGGTSSIDKFTYANDNTIAWIANLIKSRTWPVATQV
mgnify:FL=1